MKTWKPDTCDCLIEEIYNGTEIIGGGQVLKKCIAHQSVPDNELYGVLYSNTDGENKRKNQVIRALLGYDGIDLGLQETKINADGSSYIDFKGGINVNWSWVGSGANRVLNIVVNGQSLTTNQKNLIRNFCNTKFGNNKVEIL